MGVRQQKNHALGLAERVRAEDNTDSGEWYTPPEEDIVPISEDGETASYSLLLTLNDFGKSFLIVDDYLADPDAPETKGFTLE